MALGRGPGLTCFKADLATYKELPLPAQLCSLLRELLPTGGCSNSDRAT